MSEKNTLHPGQNRRGWAFAEDSEPIAASLCWEKDSAQLILVSKYDYPNSRWPEALNPLHSYQTPHSFSFVDDLGAVELVDCLTVRFTRGAGSLEVENWTLQPKMLIFGGNGKTWSSVSRVTTYIPMLQRWMGQSAHLVDWDFAEADKTWLAVQLLNGHTVSTCGSIEHRIEVQSRTESDILSNSIRAFNIARMTTDLEDSAKRDAAIDEHEAILDLLSIIYGRQIGFSKRTLEPYENLVLDFNEREIDPELRKSCEIIYPATEQGLTDYEGLDYTEAILRYRPENEALFSSWLEFWSKNRPGVAALKRALFESSSWENRLVNAAVAFEEFGHRIEGRADYRTNADNFPTYIKRLCLDMPRIAMMRPENWAARFNRAYKGLKHADNDYPELREIVVTAEQAINYLRAWCCFKADPDNPIMDYTWRNMVDFEEFESTADTPDTNHWDALLSIEVLEVEFRRLEMARTDQHRNGR